MRKSGDFIRDTEGVPNVMTYWQHSTIEGHEIIRSSFSSVCLTKVKTWYFLYIYAYIFFYIHRLDSKWDTFELLGVEQPKVRDVLFLLILNKENSNCFHYSISLIAYFKYLYFFCSSFSLLNNFSFTIQWQFTQTMVKLPWRKLLKVGVW